MKTITSCLIVIAAMATNAAESPRTFSHPDRIRYDRQCLTIDGRDTFLYSGSFHYFRCPKPLWRDRFQKIKDAGFNAVETYAAWNWHESEMPSGTNDFSKVDLTALDDWLTMAEDFGLYVIVRPGPYICAEWDTGGFPQWLLAKKPATPNGDAWLRSDDPVFLAWSRHWFDAVCPVIAKHQITRKAPGRPGVILFQIENEYDYAGVPDAAKRRHLRFLADAALANGIDVPLFTCWTRQIRHTDDPVLRDVFDSYNTYPRWNVNEVTKSVTALRREQPDAPLMTAELQGGWFSQVGGKLSEEQDGVTAAQINNLTLLAIQNGETILNYYMLFGGTNPGGRAARTITATYDYNAPIREWGGVGDRYQRVRAIAQMLREHGPRLARADAVECDVAGPQEDVFVSLRRAADGGRYVFVRTSQHTAPRTGTARVKEKTGDAPELVFDYALEPFGSKILYLPPGATDAARGEWLPKAAPDIERPKALPAPIAITTAQRRVDPGPAHWTKLQSGQNLAQLGVSDSRFVFYRAKISATAETNLVVEHPSGDTALAGVKGKPLARGRSTQKHSVFVVPAGTREVELLYESLGHANGGAAMENPDGITAAHLTPRSLSGGRPVAGWRMREVQSTKAGEEVKPDFADADWKAVTVDDAEADTLPENTTAVYRARVELTDADLRGGKMNLTFARVDDRGWVFVNGKKIGDTTDWSRAYAFDVSKELHAGTNVIAVIVHNNDGDGGIGEPTLGVELEGTAAPLVAFGSPAGIEDQWWDPALKEKNWDNVTIGSTPAGDVLLAWYRMKFSLPSPQLGVWVPWHLRLHAAGNGFLYLNGHAIGRYWQAGPQHDFFLPECWLNFGPGKTNVVTLSLRPLEKGAAIESAVVEPYAEFAEQR